MNNNASNILLGASMLYSEKRMEKFREAFLKKDKEKLKKGSASLQAFMNLPVYAKNQEFKNAAAQFYTTKNDLPEVVTQSFDKFTNFESYDNRWEEAFRVRTFDSNTNYFSIIDATDLITFEEIQEGGRVAIQSVSASQAIVKAKTYGAGLGWTYEMLEDRRFSEMVDVAELFRERYFLHKAQLHYKLLTDAAESQATIPFQGVGTTPAEELRRTMDTIQLVANTIRKDCKDMGYGDTATAPLIIYGSPLVEGRVLAALQSRNVSLINPMQMNSGSIVFRPTFNLVSSAGAFGDTDLLMVLPERKIQRGDKLMPTTYTDDDITSFSAIQTVRARYGAGVGQVKQVRKFELA